MRSCILRRDSLPLRARRRAPDPAGAGDTGADARALAGAAIFQGATGSPARWPAAPLRRPTITGAA